MYDEYKTILTSQMLKKKTKKKPVKDLIWNFDIKLMYFD